MTRIAFVAPPFAGHLYPLLELAEAARAAGYQAEFVSGDAKRQAVEGRGFPFHSLPSLAERTLESVANTSQRVGSNPIRLLRQLRQGLAVSHQAKHELAALWRHNPPDLIIADSVAIIGGLVAEELGIPWITTAATPFAMECRRGVPSYLGGWTEGQSWRHQMRDALGRMLVRGTKRTIGFLVRRQLRELGAHVYRSDGSEACYSPTAILGFGIPELEFERDWPRGFRMIGPLFANPEPSFPLPLPPGSPRILVTLGTHLPWAKANLPEDLAWLASRRPGVTFVGSMGAPERMGEAPRTLAPNASLFPFIPYADHLGTFDAIIHHGGAGVTYAAIAKGKPAIVIPHDYDQFDFAARVAAKGAGLRVAKLRSAETLAALDQVLVPGNFPRLAALSSACRRLPAHGFLAAIAEVAPLTTDS